MAFGQLSNRGGGSSFAVTGSGSSSKEKYTCYLQVAIDTSRGDPAGDPGPWGLNQGDMAAACNVQPMGGGDFSNISMQAQLTLSCWCMTDDQAEGLGFGSDCVGVGFSGGDRFEYSCFYKIGPCEKSDPDGSCAGYDIRNILFHVDFSDCTFPNSADIIAYCMCKKKADMMDPNAWTNPPNESKSAKKARRAFTACMKDYNNNHNPGAIGMPPCMVGAIGDAIDDIFTTDTPEGLAMAKEFCAGGYYPTAGH